ncbi:MAG TPA: hypothetical protein VI172_04070 [Candidatus Dormibacteraeota bacterium]|jgi:hypothetical protein
MIPQIGSPGWFFIPLPPTRYAPSKLAKVRIADGLIVSAHARERDPGGRFRHLHWAEGLGTWEERR